MDTSQSRRDGIDMISFTGLTRAGITIPRNSAATLKRIQLELGGKGANIIFAGTDKKVVKRGILHCFTNAGQSCNVPSRMLVERSIYDDAVGIAADATRTVRCCSAREGAGILGQRQAGSNLRKLKISIGPESMKEPDGWRVGLADSRG